MRTNVVSNGASMSWSVQGTSCSQSGFSGSQDVECCLAPGEYSVSCASSSGSGWNGGSLVMIGDQTQRTLCSVTGWSQSNTVAVAYYCSDRSRVRQTSCGGWFSS